MFDLFKRVFKNLFGASNKKTNAEEHAGEATVEGSPLQNPKVPSIPAAPAMEAQNASEKENADDLQKQSSVRSDSVNKTQHPQTVGTAKDAAKPHKNAARASVPTAIEGSIITSSASSNRPVVSARAADSDRQSRTASKSSGSNGVLSRETTNVSEHASARRPAVSSNSQRRVAPNSARRSSKDYSVYIGLDFGTTFTKAAYEIAPSNVHTKYSVKFGNEGTPGDYYFPSILYFDTDKQELKLSDNTGLCETIRYFKYNMISEALQKNEALNNPGFITKAPKEQLCCIFFLSYVIALIREAVISDFGNGTIAADTKWYINMGVPLEAHKDDARAALYKKVLEMAFLFESQHHGRESVSIYELDDFYETHKNESNDHINILPEIYAEVLLYQQYLNTPAGFYTVIDIGGGTEDIATFLKTTNHYGETVECLAQNVIGYGFDAISEKIAKRLDAHSVEEARAFLMRKDIDFNSDSMLRQMLPKTVEYDSLISARLKCRSLFGGCVQSARKKRVDVLKQTVDSRLPMYIFIMGGACTVVFYLSSIEFMKEAQKNAGIPYFKNANVFDYAGRNTRLKIRNDQRLIISQMLAQPFELIPEIDNMPWDLKEYDVVKKGLTWLDLQDRQNELYPD